MLDKLEVWGIPAAVTSSSPPERIRSTWSPWGSTIGSGRFAAATKCPGESRNRTFTSTGPPGWVWLPKTAWPWRILPPEFSRPGGRGACR